MIHALTIPDWLPTPLNVLLRSYYLTRAKLKRRDALMVAAESLLQAIPKATTRRRVSFVFTCGPKGRLRDADSMLKSLLDALVAARLICDDGPAWCELGTVEVVRGQEKSTVIVLEDLPS